MRAKRLIWVAVAGITLTATPALAVERIGGVSAKMGTLGIGAEYVQPISEHFSLRAGLNFLNWSYDFDASDIEYEGDLKLKTFSLLADIHPFANGFRLTGGAMYNSNKIDVTAKSSSGSYEINDVDYPAEAIESISGEVEFDDFSPYFGIGWGVDQSADSPWSFNFDLGVLYQGEPDPQLTGRCSAGVPAAVCSQFQANLSAEEKELKRDPEDYNFYPVLSLGVTYSFEPARRPPGLTAVFCNRGASLFL